MNDIVDTYQPPDVEYRSDFSLTTDLLSPTNQPASRPASQPANRRNSAFAGAKWQVSLNPGTIAIGIESFFSFFFFTYVFVLYVCTYSHVYHTSLRGGRP